MLSSRSMNADDDVFVCWSVEDGGVAYALSGAARDALHTETSFRSRTFKVDSLREVWEVWEVAEKAIRRLLYRRVVYYMIGRLAGPGARRDRTLPMLACMQDLLLYSPFLRIDGDLERESAALMGDSPSLFE